MKRKHLFILALPLIFLACGKSNDCAETGGVPTSTEVASVQNYLTSKGIVAQQDSRGFYYEILGTGYGVNSPTLASNVTVKYKGTLTDGSIFDSTATGATVSFPLSNVIRGWQYGVPLVKKAGVINLYLPPSLAYGCTSKPGIPSNSILIFRVELVNY